MTAVDVEMFEQFLTDSFAGGFQFKELRLSAEELDYMKAKYPNARMKPMETRTYPDDKVWFEVTM